MQLVFSFDNGDRIVVIHRVREIKQLTKSDTIRIVSAEGTRIEDLARISDLRLTIHDGEITK